MQNKHMDVEQRRVLSLSQQIFIEMVRLCLVFAFLCVTAWRIAVTYMQISRAHCEAISCHRLVDLNRLFPQHNSGWSNLSYSRKQM